MPQLSRTCNTCSRPIPADSVVCPLCGADLPTSLMVDPVSTKTATMDPVRDRLQAALGTGFDLGARLGEGGFGVVYRARDVRLRRDVAVKLLRRELVSTEGFVERFEREAQALAALRHPNIVPVYSIGDQGELIFLVMPFVEGITLTDYLREHSPLSLDEAERILGAVGSALTAAHAVGLVHRDIKPDNIMLEGPDRHPLLMDFGIAKVGQSGGGRRGGVGLTSTGMVLGTPLYMSPEQATADPTMDARSDIYSLGVLAYQMLTGELPFNGDSVQAVLGQHLMTPVPEARALRPEVPARFSAAVRRAMAKRPAERFQRVEEFIEALAGRGSVAGPRRSGLPERRTLVTGLLGGMLVALAAVGLWKGSAPVAQAPVHAEIRAQGVWLRLGTRAAPWDRALILGSLGISGLEEVSLPAHDKTPARTVVTPTLYLKAIRPDSGGISIDPIQLPARSLIALKPTGAVGVVQLTIGDSLASVPVSVSGRIAVSVQDQPVDTIPFRIDQIQLAATHGPLDFELGFEGSAVARPLVPLDVVGVSFEDVNRYRDEEQVSDQLVSTIDSGSIALAGRPSHILKKGEALRLPGFRGSVRDVAVDSQSVALTLEGTVDSLPASLGKVPTVLQVFWSNHPLASAGAGLVYLALLVLVGLYWKKGTTMRAVVAATILIITAAPLAAQRVSRMPVEAANLVVQVLASGGEDEEVGAGIVVAASTRIIIVTAGHVVRTAQQGGKVRVVFQFARNDTVEAHLDQLDRDLDLAVLSLPRDDRSTIQFAFNREGDPGTLEIGALVVPVGCPDRVCWDPPVSGDRVISASARRVRFESFFVSPGSSGGALFNREWEVVGLVTEKNSQDGVAVGMSAVADRLRKWSIPVQLSPTRIPRAGYRTRLSLVGLAPTSGGLTQSGRWPSGRFAVLLRGQERIGWHVTAIRLAPLNLKVTGGMVGTGVSLHAGRLGISPFGEVGVARVNGRFNVGSYFIQTAGGPVEVPVWQTVTNDVIGVGVGADLEFLVAPHLAVSGVVGHWSFRTDPQLPSIPNVFAGAGLKLAF